jgi:hypothetical protein
MGGAKEAGDGAEENGVDEEGRAGQARKANKIREQLSGLQRLA